MTQECRDTQFTLACSRFWVHHNVSTLKKKGKWPIIKNKNKIYSVCIYRAGRPAHPSPTYFQLLKNPTVVIYTLLEAQTLWLLLSLSALLLSLSLSLCFSCLSFYRLACFPYALTSSLSSYKRNHHKNPVSRCYGYVFCSGFYLCFRRCCCCSSFCCCLRWF